MGERAKNIGDEAEDKIWYFLSSLGYQFQDTNEEKYNIDCIALSPPENPKVGLARPRYSPKEGLVAFEVKEPKATIERVNKFRKKILKYNKENQKKIRGGIYIADSKISPSMLKYMKRRQIWGWGQRRIRLYRQKASIFDSFFKKNFCSEVIVEPKVTFIRVSTLNTKQLLRISVFIDDLSVKTSPSLLTNIMNKIKKKSLIPLMNLGIRPLRVYFEYHSIGGKSKRLREELYKTIALPWKDEGILVLIDQESYNDYRTFPMI